MDLVTHVVAAPTAERVLLLVHGLGADERDLSGLLPYLDPEGRFATVLPRGPYELDGMAGYAWYPWTGPGTFDPEAFASSLDALDELLDTTCTERNLAREQALVGGFSMGAGLSLALGLRAGPRSHPLGVLAMSPALPGLDAFTLDRDGAASVPVLLQHGTDDPLIPVPRSRDLARALQTHGVPVVYSEYPIGHQVAIEGLQEAHAWIGAVVAGERPAEPVADDPPEGPVAAVTTATFDAEVLRAPVPVIVDFWAPWCGPCRQVAPVVEQIAMMREGSYKVVKVNIDDEPALAQRYEVQSIPLVALFRDGHLERSALGAKPRQQLEAELGMLVIP